jgi:probable HAF family extracellular repeat protein
MKIRTFVIYLMLAITVGGLSAQTASRYSYTIVDYPGAFNTGVFGINGAGQFSGTFFGSDGVARAFIYGDGKFTPLDYPKADRTFGFGINDAGSIVGYYIDSDNRTHGFLYARQNFSTVDYPNAKTTRALGINTSGQIVGGYVDSATATHGFIFKDGKFTSIDYPGATRTEAYGINDAGWIVGYYADSNNAIHGFVDKAGTLATVDFPGALRTNPYGINKSGQISGSYIDRGRNHGYISSAANSKLNIPGALSTFGFALNDSGTVVGQCVDLDSVDHGFIATLDKVQAPQISARLDPDWILAGTNGFKLKVRGFGFTPGAVLHWNGSERVTTFDDDSNLTVTIPPADIAKPGSVLLTVINPGPNGGTSNVVAFPVRATPAP